MNHSKVLIIGAGWAGLSAAIKLAEQDIPTTILEAAPYIGGRARAVPFEDSQVDNGQHLLIGAYHELFKLFRIINVDFDKIIRKPLALTILSKTSQMQLQLSSSKSVLNLLFALLKAKGLSFTEKLAALQFSYTLTKKLQLDNDISVEDLLTKYKQPKRLNDMLWKPLCLASLSTDASIASSKLFINVLKDCFGTKPQDADIILPKTDLSQAFPIPAEKYLTTKNTKLITRARANSLLIKDDICIGAKTNKGDFAADNIILATPFVQALRLLPENSRSNYKFLEHFKNQVITTIYLQYPQQYKLKQEFIGLTDCISHWVFDRSYADQPGLLAVVITGDDLITDFSNQQLVEIVSQEIKQYFPSFVSKPLSYKVIREKHAAFVADLKAAMVRPSYDTGIGNLWLAGDYTYQRYPATLESAARSGVETADLIKARL